MGTRCNIKISYGDNDIYIYRHWDGYLSQTGKDVYDKLQNSRKENYSMGEKDEASRINIPNFINSFLLDNRYELTTGVHGDIEYLYHFEFSTEALIQYLTVYRYEEGRTAKSELMPTEYKPWAEGQTSFYNPFEFTFYEEVEKEIEATEKRVKQLKKDGSLPDYKSYQFEKAVAQ